MFRKKCDMLCYAWQPLRLLFFDVFNIPKEVISKVFN